VRLRAWDDSNDQRNVRGGAAVYIADVDELSKQELSAGGAGGM